jgi:hypothetical protein
LQREGPEIRRPDRDKAVLEGQGDLRQLEPGSRLGEQPTSEAGVLHCAADHEIE